MTSSSLRFAFLVAALLSVACATGRSVSPAVLASTQAQPSAEQSRPLNDAALRVHRERQDRMRAGYHAALDQASVLIVDLLEGSVDVGAWRVSYSLMQPRDSNEAQIYGDDCVITATSRPTCAIVIPPHYPEFYLYVNSLDRGVNQPFTGRLRVRRANGEVVEYRTATYEAPTGMNIMAPSRALDAREARQAPATPVSR